MVAILVAIFLSSGLGPPPGSVRTLAVSALGLWLFAFTALLGRSNPMTFWNNAMVALAVFVLSLVGGERHRVVGPVY